MLSSNDGYRWIELDSNLLKPMIGDKIMRDPSIAKGPDGTFHLVWTCAWKGNSGFGHASSKDLVHWSSQDLVNVMKNEPTTVNVWAPELFYDEDEKQYIIIWASTIPFRFAKGIEEEENNHRMYYVATKDFKSYSETRLFYDPGFSVIDCTIVKRGKKDFVLVLKDNTRPNRNLRVAFGTSALGPYGKSSEPFTAKLTEGPSVEKVGKKWIIYYDNYGIKKYGAAETTDFKTFTDISDKIQIPEGHKHGTIIKTVNPFRKSNHIANPLESAVSKTKHTANPVLASSPKLEERRRGGVGFSAEARRAKEGVGKLTTTETASQ